MDILVDLMIGLNDPYFDTRRAGRLLLAALPAETLVIVLDLDTETARQRSPELVGDRSHGHRRALYLQLARRRGIAIVSAESSVAVTNNDVLQTVFSTISHEPPARCQHPNGDWRHQAVDTRTPKAKRS